MNAALESPPAARPVLILGGGINGAALARELVLNRVPVWLVDTHDLAYGATAYSSRLIHGGLRYLEYAEFSLVRESLHERERLLQLAPQFVRPLKLFIPVSNSLGGFWAAGRRFLGAAIPSAAGTRGYWLVRSGLWMYSTLAGRSRLPPPETHRLTDANVPPVNQRRFASLCSYWDAQVRFPERFTLSLLTDAQEEARQLKIDFRILTRTSARLTSDGVMLRSTANSDSPVLLHPTAVVNATGAWVDRALADFGASVPPLMAGTKGSHLVTAHPQLRSYLAAGGLYTEAQDGRPIFVLPFGDLCLIGTTDIPFGGDPATAVATPAELDYLLQTVNELFPGLQLRSSDVLLHYSGVRPLPKSDAHNTSAVTRRHFLQEHPNAPLPLYSIIGGKLTTCRSLAEQACDTLLARLQLPRRAESRDRPLPGGENFPPASRLALVQQQLAQQADLPLDAILALWELWGTRTAQVLAEIATYPPSDRTLLTGTQLPVGAARFAIRHEWAATLDDLVERRLMLLYTPGLNRATLDQLAGVLTEESHLSSTDQGAAVAACATRLREHFGKSC